MAMRPSLFCRTKTKDYEKDITHCGRQPVRYDGKCPEGNKQQDAEDYRPRQPAIGGLRVRQRHGVQHFIGFRSSYARGGCSGWLTMSQRRVTSSKLRTRRAMLPNGKVRAVILSILRAGRLVVICASRTSKDSSRPSTILQADNIILSKTHQIAVTHAAVQPSVGRLFFASAAIIGTNLNNYPPTAQNAP